MSEHPIEQPIAGLTVYIDANSDPVFYRVGHEGVTRIEPCTKSGMHANIPYLRVWAGEVCAAEFCQHSIVGVLFARTEGA